MFTSVFDETWSELILATRRIFLYVTERKKPAALGQASKNEVLMHIGMTAAQNDERGDQGLARAVDKKS